MPKKILITGGSGFIGTNLVEFYLQRSESVTNFDIAEPKNRRHFALWKCIDICDIARLETAMLECAPDVIIHLAARTDLDGKAIGDYTANTTGVSNMIRVIKKLPVKPAVVFASSMLVCRLGHQPIDEHEYCPESPYGVSKVEGEKIVHTTIQNSFAWALVRPISIWGPWNGIPYISFLEAVQKGWYIHPGNTVVLRNYGFVLNTVRQIDAVVNAVEAGRVGFTTYLGDYTPIDILSWGNAIQQEMNAPKIRCFPLTVFRGAALVGDILNKLGTHFPVTSFRLNNMLTPALYNLSFLQEICPDLPYTMEDGVKATVAWHYGSKKDGQPNK